ncbi:hypothetical protein LEMLEM_LOCUS12065 [Lemmus lemmus]
MQWTPVHTDLKEPCVLQETCKTFQGIRSRPIQACNVRCLSTRMFHPCV